MPTWTCNGKYPGYELPVDEKRKHLYHFTSFDSFVKIWLTKELLFADVRKVNDLIEQTVQWNFQNPQKLPLMGAIEDGRYAYKQISLTMDYDSYLKGCMSSLMWGYYADKTNGVCIEFDFDKLPLSEDCLHAPISYIENVPISIDVPSDLSTRNDVERWIIENQSRFFFTKQSTWREENEYRIVSNSKRSLSIVDAITAVYVARYDSDTCKFVLSLVNGDVPVLSLSFKDASGISIPRITDAAENRRLIENTLKSKSNALNPIREQALNFYNAHKDDWDFPMILKEYIFEK